ncbi:ras GEF [Auriscalpium vulgare]|uniref:Ras GEF n=1 Tax=Auriscalpium vulgare TaxID=40419 RepID=A0ACB8S7B6_9AGAM|nr:ras GEF [Auriscalpium vulgare]
MNSPSDLPTIPSLPPIVMPDTSLFSTPGRLHSLGEGSSPASPAALPPLRAGSQLSPLTSPSDYIRPSPTQTQSLAPPTSLRKSVSVDSFVRYSPTSPVTVTARPARTNTLGPGYEDLRAGSPGVHLAWQPPRADPPHVSYQQRDSRFPLSGRSRGASISTIGDDYHRTLVEDSDEDSNEPLHLSDFHKAAARGKEKQRLVISPGDLPLPTKLPALSPPSSVSSVSISSMTNGDDTPRLPSSGVTHLLMNAGGLSRPARLARSGSFDAADTKGDGSYISTASATNPSEVTLAVVGGKGCGKSAAIAKGLRAYKLSEPATVTDHNSGYGPFTYTLREGKIGDDTAPECVLNVLELDATVLKDKRMDQYIWPDGAPSLDGVVVCYDVSRKETFVHVEDLIRCFTDLHLPIVVFACKCDLTKDDPAKKAEQLREVHALMKLDVGLIEISVMEDQGKGQLRLGFEWLLKSIARATRGRRVRGPDDFYYHNPASPDVLVSPPPWEISRSSTATPTAASVVPGIAASRSASSAPAPPRSPNAPTSPTRARSTNDLLASDLERADLSRERSRSIIDLRANGNGGAGVSKPEPGPNDSLGATDESFEERPENRERERESRPVAFATLEELLDKLLFLAVSGDDWGYISHFLLTYRRFASPRSVVLAMQKRMRQLDQSSTDPMFACFAQMRICHLLEVWIQDYPHDFAVGAAADALTALVKSIISKTHLLHYGSDFLPFLESRPLVDKDAAWALKVDETPDESDDSYSLSEDEEDHLGSEPPTRTSVQASQRKLTSSSGPTSARERKSSLPLTAKALVMPDVMADTTLYTTDADPSPKQLLKDLLLMSNDLTLIPANDIAEEITRIETRLFLRIEPRHWLVHTLVSGKKDPELDSIAGFSALSNHLADWVVSLILCHDRSRNRAKQIEKLVEVADKLRSLNNYSALRAFVAGINNASYPGDPAMTMFQQKNPTLYKHLQSWDLLLQSARSHRSYRMALRNTKGACIPALEVHLSDLIRAHEGNDDFSSKDPQKIHWAKFNMIGKFIQTTTQFQAQCRSASNYSFGERRPICEMILKGLVMDPEMQRSRITPPSELEEADERDRAHLPRTTSREYPDRPRDAVNFRRLMFWN